MRSEKGAPVAVSLVISPASAFSSFGSLRDASRIRQKKAFIPWYKENPPLFFGGGRVNTLQSTKREGERKKIESPVRLLTPPLPDNAQ